MSEDTYIQIEGFRSERDFTRHLCYQILGLVGDVYNGRVESMSKRLQSLTESADTYLLLYGHGICGQDIIGAKATESQHENK